MLRKRQVATIVSIAVVSFLIGTSVATDGGNPFDALWNAFYGLESRVEALEDQSIPHGFITAPTYDSGWVTISENSWTRLEHNLNTLELLVYVLGKDDDGLIHQMGLNERDSAVYQLRWRSNSTTIELRRGTVTTGYWENIRVLIWRIQESPT